MVGQIIPWRDECLRNTGATYPVALEALGSIVGERPYQRRFSLLELCYCSLITSWTGEGLFSSLRSR